MLKSALLSLALPALLLTALPADARTVYRCVRDNTVSLATAPEPGSRCEPREIADDAVRLPNLWGELGLVKGTLYEREQDGRTVYSTRNLPGSRPVVGFTVETPEGEPAHSGLGTMEAPPRVDRYAAQFRAASKRTGVDEAWLRAIAHAESGFNAKAVSPKGALGVMQLMPDTARDYGVRDPLSPEESIDAGARHLGRLMKRYRGDLVLVAAAYNAGAGVVARHGGVPPYRETREYVAKVQALYARYLAALGRSPAAHPPRLSAAK